MPMSEESCQPLSLSESVDPSLKPEDYNTILDIQQKILADIGQQKCTQDILDHLCKLAEKSLPNSVASIMLKDPRTELLFVRSAPSIPKEGHEALNNLKPGPTGGSCGNAVFHNKPQYVSNTYEDPRWEDLRTLAKDFNLHACWSMPIVDKSGKTIGSFALSSFENRSPSAFHKKLLHAASAMVTIILNMEQTQKRIALFNMANQTASEGMIITDKDNKIIEINEAFTKIYGYTEQDIIGHDPKILSSHKHNKVFYQSMWEKIHSQGRWSGTITNKKADGSEIYQWMSISTLKNDEGEIQNYLAIFSDMTDLLSSKNRVEFMAYHDTLTGLYNKTHFEQTLNSHTQYTLIMLNLDSFSFFNTIYGFETGDRLLQKVADELTHFCKLSEIYRIDADEFGLLFHEPIDAKSTIKKIQKHFQELTLNIDGLSLNISFCYGVSFGNRELLQNGALALKWAKELGKNRYYIFDDDYELISSERREKFIQSNNLLNRAFKEDLFVPFFQGIHDNKSQSIEKFEVLVRIKDKEAIYAPSEFLETADVSGRLSDITKIIIEKSFKIMQDYTYSFSINITEDDLSRNYLVNFLGLKSQEYRINPDRVTLEILEGISSHGKASHSQQLMELKALGFHLAIDDFGAEYSNFERVLDLEIDFLKIDSKYIKDIDVNPKSLEIARAIAFFAKNSRIESIAEFVHDEKVQAIVAALGINYSQGFHFSKPKEFPDANILN